MNIYSLSKATEYYTTDYELYGLFSSIDKANKYAKSENQNLKIQGIDTITNTDYSYWVINVWVVDLGMEVM
jgi:hypothetical protein